MSTSCLFEYTHIFIENVGKARQKYTLLEEMSGKENFATAQDPWARFPSTHPKVGSFHEQEKKNLM